MRHTLTADRRAALCALPALLLAPAPSPASSQFDLSWTGPGQYLTNVVDLARDATTPPTSMDELVDALQREGRLPTPQVRAALRRVDRRAFVPADQRGSAYEMRPLALSYRTECFTAACDHGKRVADATISSPSYHAAALEFLYPALSSRPPNSATVLDVGCGSGYLLAAFAALGARAAHGVEYAPDLAKLAESNLRAHDAALLDGGRVTVTTGDGWNGLPAKAPFDAIYVGAAATSVPRALVDQLRPGGRMVVPVGKQASKATLLRVDKDGAGVVSVEPLMAVNFVPLVGSDG